MIQTNKELRKCFYKILEITNRNEFNIVIMNENPFISENKIILRRCHLYTMLTHLSHLNFLQ